MKGRPPRNLISRKFMVDLWGDITGLIELNWGQIREHVFSLRITRAE